MHKYIKFKLLEFVENGKKVMRLFYITKNDFGKECLSFKWFRESMEEEGLAENTQRQYSYRLANHLDFLAIGFDIIGGSETEKVSELLGLYDSYLTLGAMASSPTVARINEISPSPLIAKESSSQYHTTLEIFYKLSGTYKEKYNLFKECAIELPEWDGVMFDGAKVAIRQVSQYEQSAINDSFSGRGGGAKPRKRRRNKIFRNVGYYNRTEDDIDKAKFFPLNKISELIRSASSHRNAALYALAAATSLRPSECLQILWRDINPYTLEIFAIEPWSRPDFAQAYAGMTELELKQLSWKGRKTKYTLLLEPYGELFFKHLELYKKYEYDDSVVHDFVFQTEYGDPLYLSDYGSVIIDPFKKAATRVLGDTFDLKKFGLHSLRHSYCVFFKNFVPHSEGVGLSDHEIMLLTGHADLKSVRKYAKIDRQLLLSKLSVAFIDRQAGDYRSYNEMLLGVFEQNILDVKRKIEIEQSLVTEND